VGTLEAYLERNGAMGATAQAIYAHRHTVAYRLERVRELTGLYPAVSDDRERLGLGLKAHRLLAPRLPR
jgi:DNA-binding PucR family transcriptional regulator